MDYKIKPKPWILRRFTMPFQWVTFYPNIYMPEGQTLNNALLEHELCHMRQQLKTGKWLYMLKYLFSKKFQYKMEIEAIAVEIFHTAPNLRQHLIQEYALLLISSAYSHCAPSYETALNDLNIAFENIK